MRTTLTISLTAVALLIGCSDSRDALRTRTAPKPILVDEYSVLDDQASGKPLSNQALQKKLEEARRHYLLAMRASDHGNTALASRHFESAIGILNDLITYPNIDANPEFTKLSESLIRDYEEQITSIDSLDQNSSFFVLRDKMFQEIETIPVDRRSYPSTGVRTIALEDFQIALSDNTPVQQCITFFTSERGRKFFSKWLERSGRFFPLFDRILTEENAPPELRYLSMIESGLNTTVVSHAKAVGLWQFISATGEAYGLKINWWVDERRNPEKATRAAARYLNDLFADLGDWHLALAAYNCGPGRVKSAIAKAGSRDYWEVRKFLPRETQQYVPLYIAAAKITMDPEAYGFTNIKYEQPDEYENIRVNSSYDLPTLAQAIEISVDDLRTLNPELLRDRIPESPSGYALVVPTDAPRDLAARLEDLPVPDPASFEVVKHKVRKGESIGEIAKKYGAELADVYDANNMNVRSKLRTGSTLRVPLRNGAKPAQEPAAELAANTTPSTGTPDAAPSTRTESEQTGRPVAKTPVDEPQLASTSNSSIDLATPRPQTTAAARRTTTATAQATTTKYHTVRRGETMSGIAKKYGISTSNLAEMNGLSRKAEVQKGQKLKVQVSTSQSQMAEDQPTTKKRDRSLAASDEPSSKARKRSVTTTKYETHKVRKGESLISLADRYGVTVDDLKAWNRDAVRGKSLQAGAKLKIYSESPSKGDTRKSSRASKSATKKHKIRRGDTLQEIANKYGVSVSELKRNNPGLSDKKLKAGQSIRINK